MFKIAVLVFQCLAGQAPSYLSDDCQPVSDSRPRRLRSSDSLSCVVRRAHNTYGDRCFATAGPQVWNSLPTELQQCSSLRQFKWCLKTFLFGSWDYGALWFFVKQRRVEIVLLTYLLTKNVEAGNIGALMWPWFRLVIEFISLFIMSLNDWHNVTQWSCNALQLPFFSSFCSMEVHHFYCHSWRLRGSIIRTAISSLLLSYVRP